MAKSRDTLVYLYSPFVNIIVVVRKQFVDTINTKRQNLGKKSQKTVNLFF